MSRAGVLTPEVG